MFVNAADFCAKVCAMITLTRAAWRHHLLILLIAAALVRVAVYLLFPATFAFEQTGAIHGSSSFDVYAVNLINTGVYGLTPGVPDAVLPPLYSVFVAGVYALFGRSSLAIALMHTLLDLISITLLVMITRRLFAVRGQVIGVLAGAFYAAYPYLIFQNLTLIDTPLFITLLHAFVYLVMLLRQRERLDGITWVIAAAAGITLGAGAMVRPVIVFLALPLPLWFWARLPLTQTILRLIPVAVLSLLPLLPWTVRNYGVYGEFVAMSVTAGSNFYQGNNPDVIPLMRAGYDVQWTAPDPALIHNPPASPAADRERSALALDWLRENPAIIPELIWVKFLTHWSIDIFPSLNPTEGADPSAITSGDAAITAAPDGGVTITGLPQGDPVAEYSGGAFALGRVIHRYYVGVLLLFALIGVVVTARQWREISLLWIVQISMTLAYVIFHPSTRYRVPTDPLLFVLSAAAFVSLADVLIRRRRL